MFKTKKEKAMIKEEKLQNKRNKNIETCKKIIKNNIIYYAKAIIDWDDEEIGILYMK